MLSYSGIENWQSTLSARQLAAARVLCEGKHQGRSGRGELPRLAASPHPGRQAARAATAGSERCNLPASTS